MAVRKSESRIPGGFDKGAELGDATASADGNYVLVSYLSNPVVKRIDWKSKCFLRDNFFRNTYVLFVNTSQVAEPVDYAWKLEFFKEGAAAPIHTIQHTDPNGKYVLETEKIDPEILCAADEVTKVTVTVTPNGAAPLPPVDQTFVKSDANIEALLLSTQRSGLSLGGYTAVTRLLANEFRNDFRALPGALAKLVAAIVFVRLLVISSSYGDTAYDDVSNRTREWEDVVNQGTSILAARSDLGVAGIRAQTLAMFTQRAGDPHTMLAPLVVDGRPQQLLTNFAAAPEHDRIDLINQLRFPKASIQRCAFFLEALKARSTWAGDDWDVVAGIEEALVAILSDFERGPTGTPLKTPFVKQAMEAIHSPFIAFIVEGSLCETLRKPLTLEIPVADDRHLARVLKQLKDFRQVTAAYTMAADPPPGDRVMELLELVFEPKKLRGATGLRFFYLVQAGPPRKNWFSLERIDSLCCANSVEEVDVVNGRAELEAWLTKMKAAFLAPNPACPVITSPSGSDPLATLDTWLARTRAWNPVPPLERIPVISVSSGITEVLDLDVGCIPKPVLDPNTANVDVEELEVQQLKFKLDEPPEGSFLGRSPNQVLVDDSEVLKLGVILGTMQTLTTRSRFPLRLVIRGYADKLVPPDNPADYNQNLSLRRAQWVEAKILDGMSSYFPAAQRDVAGCGDSLAPADAAPDYRDVRIILIPEEPK